MSRGESFFTKEAACFGCNLTKISKLTIDVDVRMDYDKVYTLLLQNDSAKISYEIVTSLWPVYTLLSEDQQYGFTLGMPINSYNLHFKNRINSGADFHFNGPFLNSGLYVYYVFTAFTKLEMNARMTNDISDINDFIVNPIQISCQYQTVRTSIWAMNRSFSSSINLEYKKKLHLFFANGSVSYGSLMRNILNNQIISTSNANIGINSSGLANK